MRRAAPSAPRTDARRPEIGRRDGCEDGPVIPDPKAWMWFLSSYGPLWIMLGLRFSSHVARISLIAFGLACIAYVVFIVQLLA